MTDKECLLKIISFHPSLGVEDGLSYYNGGMKDTGGWDFKKLLFLSTEELHNLVLKYDVKTQVMLQPNIIQETIDDRLVFYTSQKCYEEEKESYEKIFKDARNQALWGVSDLKIVFQEDDTISNDEINEVVQNNTSGFTPCQIVDLLQVKDKIDFYNLIKQFKDENNKEFKPIIKEAVEELKEKELMDLLEKYQDNPINKKLVFDPISNRFDLINKEISTDNQSTQEWIVVDTKEFDNEWEVLDYREVIATREFYECNNQWDYTLWEDDTKTYEIDEIEVVEELEHDKFDRCIKAKIRIINK